MNRGLLYGVVAYLLWGLLPVYWKALASIPAPEIMAHRVVWSFVSVLALLVVRRHWRWVGAAVHNRPALWAAAAAAALLTANWLTYIWAVNAGYVVETSLGYFINPLANVLLGVLVLGERLRAGQWVAVGLAACGVLYLTLNVGYLPWIALTLAFTFALYGLIKKRVALPAMEGFSLEMGMLVLPAGLFLGWSRAVGTGAWGQVGLATTLLLVGSGIVTAIPLISFAAAARRIPLSTLGLLQYIAPTFQFLLGVYLFGEALTEARLIGFLVIWTALLIYSVEGIYVRRKRGQAQRVAWIRIGRDPA